jgi:hypothetical protein
MRPHPILVPEVDLLTFLKCCKEGYDRISTLWLDSGGALATASVDQRDEGGGGTDQDEGTAQADSICWYDDVIHSSYA